MSEKIKEFPQLEAFKTVLAKEIDPNDSDYKYVTIINSYDQDGKLKGEKFFGPVYGKFINGDRESQALSCKGFETVDYLHDKIIDYAKNTKFNDFGDLLIAGNIKKNNASWESIINAYNSKGNNGEEISLWSEIILQAFSETLIRAQHTIFIDGNDDDPELVEFFNLIDTLNIEQLTSIEKELRNFCLAYINKNDNPENYSDAKIELFDKIKKI